jgi:nitrite reductase/ring-hydroxylating ferredoxin subunit
MYDSESGPHDRLVQISSRAKNRLRAFPTGWFVLCFSDELRPGRILERKFMGQDLVVYRTASGKACVSDAFCPHMGAHFAYGGTVEGEAIRCPFHGFEFDSAGVCVKTGYGTPPPRKARLRMWHVREQNGIVLAWHHQDFRAPEWEVPPLEAAGWTGMIHHEWQIEANPYDTAENSVDIGHLSVVHGYRDVEMLSPLTTDGPLLQVRYAMSRSAGVFGKRSRLRAEFQITKWGLGYSAVEVEVKEFGLRSRHFVFPTAMDESKLSAKIAISLYEVANPAKINPALAFVPKALLNKIILGASMIGYKNDVAQDFEIWKNKTDIPRPALAEGDGPIGQFRRWTKQFDPREEINLRAAE